MAVDFKKLREAKKHQAVIDPLEIFQRLPSALIKDLYGSQVEVFRLGLPVVISKITS